jgi:hypothetical protein
VEREVIQLAVLDGELSFGEVVMHRARIDCVM